ncbi:hypothetical protein RRF57_003392 [Xylaria bambusicola]|uniref:Uncharacterized protein n=1 Tax=Xylaria bambusicola TaxID=326684 RepID=A0AAN7Z2R2_9PEZI
MENRAPVKRDLRSRRSHVPVKPTPRSAVIGNPPGLPKNGNAVDLAKKCLGAASYVPLATIPRISQGYVDVATRHTHAID